jgi:hypothetical protein
MKAMLYMCFIAFILLLMFAVPQHEASACKRLPVSTQTDTYPPRNVVHRSEKLFVLNGQELMMKDTIDIDQNGYYIPCFYGSYPNRQLYGTDDQ